MNVSERAPVKERKIGAPFLALRITDETKRLKDEPGWRSGLEDGITLAKYPHMRVVLVAMKKGMAMREHRVKGPASLYVVSGELLLAVDGNEIRLRKDELFTVRKEIPHDVRANRDSVMLLTIMAP